MAGAVCLPPVSVATETGPGPDHHTFEPQRHPATPPGFGAGGPPEAFVFFRSVGGRAHTRAMGRSIADVVDIVVDAALTGFDAEMRATGMVVPPTVYMLDERRAPSYLGSVGCRPFQRGEDAARAVTGLGLIPSVLGATRLVVAWEHGDMCTARELTGTDFPRGVVVLDAGPTRHMLRWYPLRLTVDPGGTTVVRSSFEPRYLLGDCAVREWRRDEGWNNPLVKWLHQREVRTPDRVVELDLGGEGAPR